jgi:hypothetical protein
MAFALRSNGWWASVQFSCAHQKYRAFAEAVELHPRAFRQQHALAVPRESHADFSTAPADGETAGAHQDRQELIALDRMLAAARVFRHVGDYETSLQREWQR